MRRAFSFSFNIHFYFSLVFVCLKAAGVYLFPAAMVIFSTPAGGDLF
jgi:hypothetical protein